MAILMKIKPFNKLSTVDAIHDVLNKLIVVTNNMEPQEPLLIDLSGLRYITPIGYTSLLSIFYFLEGKYEVKIKVPIDERPVKYMERMNFFEVCSQNIKSQFEEQMIMGEIYNRSRSNLKTELLETKKAFNNDDIEDINNSVKMILRSNGLRGPQLSNIQTFITELGNNVIDHTESPCFISIKNNAEEKEMEIAVVDCGIGIYESLKTTLKGKSPDEVVRDAIMTKASRLGKDGRGNGLMDVKRKAFHPSNEVILNLCTNNTVYKITENGVTPISKGTIYFGTFFQLKVTYPFA
ncbi:hypothetical protein QA612_20130 [Evansella sp. AB-P1]|uniref:hypothetical protein n=1 Tax=Evansella sp. AB-P1 TaxID=3037653 RepID=UPI0024202BC7|nr:hypothetical protein [Evansella sp. AB-P1]MDG5789771.1 hypothetical protein [Evansella sp. AB-P1]